MTRTTMRIGAAALGILLAVAACHQDQLFQPYPNGPLDPMFTRYVSMGNSITAGFQSNGINDSTQLQSYAVLLGWLYANADDDEGEPDVRHGVARKQRRPRRRDQLDKRGGLYADHGYADLRQ